MKTQTLTMRSFRFCLFTIMLLGTTSALADWDSHRERLYECAANDAICVGLQLIDIMEANDRRSTNRLNCECSILGRHTVLSCFVQDNYRRRPLTENIPFAFMDTCRAQIENAEVKKAFCTDGANRAFRLYAIDTYRLQYDLLGEYTFRDDCLRRLERLD